jgi:polyhydroxyalkanoate synthesis regulator phasin
MRRIIIFMAAAAFLCAVAIAQDDQPSLGNIARQTRAQKQQKDVPPSTSSKDASKTQSDTQGIANSQASQPKTAHVITDDDLSNHVTGKANADHPSDSKDAVKDSAKDAAEDLSKKSPSGLPAAEREELAPQWKEQIQAQKDSIAQLQRNIADVGNSIQFAGANCVQNCEQWNQSQQRKQGQVESMKAELAAEQQHLEEMQDAARKQGFGSNVYE